MIGALDIGGTHAVAGLVDVGSARVATRCRVPLSPDGTRSELLAEILHAVTEVSAPEVGRWGVAVPGPFDYEHGICTIRGVEKLDALYGVDLRQELAAVGVADARFLNDAAAFLYGEWWTGAARGHTRAVGVTLGSGLGSAFLADGRVVEGSLYRVPFRGGSVEDVISRRALRARYGGGLDVAEIAERARAGEARAKRTFDDVAAALAEFLAPWLREFGATCLVVGGSIARSWDLLAPALSRLEVDVFPAQNVDDAPLLGAAYRAWGA